MFARQTFRAVQQPLKSVSPQLSDSEEIIDQSLLADRESLFSNTAVMQRSLQAAVVQIHSSGAESQQS
jgi:hypothetical protein